MYNKENPFFSIIVPVYNVERYLRECIESIIGQSFKNFELILIDDGSNDSSGSICDEYSEQAKIIHKDNGGLSDARNVGTRQAIGKYLMYVDSDDYISNQEFLFETYQSLSNNPVDLLVFGAQKRYNKNIVDMPLTCEGNRWNGSIQQLCENGNFQISAWGKIVKSSIIKDHNIEFRYGVCSEDMEWNAKLLKYCNSTMIVNDKAYQYRQREGSISQAITEKNIQDVFNNYLYCVKVAESIAEDKKKAMNIYLAQNLSMFIISLSLLPQNVWCKYKTFFDDHADVLLNGVRKREKYIYRVYKLLGYHQLLNLLRIAYKVKRG